MTRLEAYRFIGKCLSLRAYPNRREELKAEIVSGNIDWEKVVQVSTQHYVFPALGIRLRSAGLAALVPDDFLEYVDEFIGLNRERNRQLLREAHEVNQVLQEENIHAVFLKGIGYFAERLFEDMGERMTGDIDLLVDEPELEKAAAALHGMGYIDLGPYEPVHRVINKHYPRMGHPTKLGAVEIHHQVLSYPRHAILPASDILKNSRPVAASEGLLLPSLEHQVVLNALNGLWNDEQWFYGVFSLAQSYDLLCFGMRCDVQKTLMRFGKNTKELLSSLAVAQYFLHLEGADAFENSKPFYLRRILRKIKSPQWAWISSKLLYLPHMAQRYLMQVRHVFSDPRIRKSILARLRQPGYYVQHLKRYYTGHYNHLRGKKPNN